MKSNQSKRAGRPLMRGEAKTSRCISLTPTAWAYLATSAMSANEQIEEIICGTKQFREWMKTRNVK